MTCSPTSIEAVLNAGTGQALPVAVLAHGADFTGVVGIAAFCYSAPVVTSLHASPHGHPHGPVTGRYQVMVLPMCC